ncbi:MAG: ABC transporter permease [Atribacterota bacterium]
MIFIFLRGVFSSSLLTGTSLLYATLGEVIVERSGIVNLGLEGILLIGASTGFAVTAATGSASLGLLVAALASGVFNLLFGYLVITRRANQLASGLTMMFLAFGVSALIGRHYVGAMITGLQKIPVPVLTELPWVAGSTLFNYDILVYMVIPVAFLVWFLLFYTRWGLSLRAVGENPTATFAAGRNPSFIQYQALFIGGLLGGIGDAHLSIALTLTWSELMTSGRGFIAIALVIFSKWHPLRAIVGALLFGAAEALQLQLQARGSGISPFILEMFLYVFTLLVLLIWGGVRRMAAPASLGRVFHGTE